MPSISKRPQAYKGPKTALIEAYPGGPKVRGKSEQRIALQLKEAGVSYDYETLKLKYHVSKDSTYTPDFNLNKSQVIIEVKGLFSSKDRVKHLLVKDQHPQVDIRFVFDNPQRKLSKASKTTYASWCEKYGFKYATKVIPKEWLV